MSTYPHDVFLSFSRYDEQIMQHVRTALVNAGLKVWAWSEQGSEANIKDTVLTWEQLISNIIDKSKCLTVIYTTNIPSANGVRYAVEQARLKGKKVFVLILDSIQDDIPNYLKSETEIVEAHGQWTLALVQLGREIKQHIMKTYPEYQDKVSNDMDHSIKNGCIFLSYSRKDTAFMKQVRNDLQDMKMKTWIDEENLEPGTPAWETAIGNAIRSAACIVVILSPDAEKSLWVGRELALAETLNKRIFPVLVRGTEQDAIPFRLMTHQWIDARQDYASAFEKLLGAVKKHLGM